MTLAGKRIVLTRARHQAAPLEDLIHQFGAVPLAYPCIAIAPPLDPLPLQAALSRLDQFDWLLLTSGNAVHAIAQNLPAAPPPKIAAVGTATANAARQHLAWQPQFLPSQTGAAPLARSLPINRRCRILLPQSNLADPAAAAILRARGAEVTAVIAYRTVIGAGGIDLPRRLSRVDALTFSSPSAVAFFRRRCPAPLALRLPASCIGPATACAARAAGFAAVMTASSPGLRPMLTALADHFAVSS